MDNLIPRSNIVVKERDMVGEGLVHDIAAIIESRGTHARVPACIASYFLPYTNSVLKACLNKIREDKDYCDLKTIIGLCWQDQGFQPGTVVKYKGSDVLIVSSTCFITYDGRFIVSECIDGKGVITVSNYHLRSVPNRAGVMWDDDTKKATISLYYMLLYSTMFEAGVHEVYRTGLEIERFIDGIIKYDHDTDNINRTCVYIDFDITLPTKEMYGSDYMVYEVQDIEDRTLARIGVADRNVYFESSVGGLHNAKMTDRLYQIHCAFAQKSPKMLDGIFIQFLCTIHGIRFSVDTACSGIVDRLRSVNYRKFKAVHNTEEL